MRLSYRSCMFLGVCYFFPEAVQNKTLNVVLYLFLLTIHPFLFVKEQKFFVLWLQVIACILYLYCTWNFDFDMYYINIYVCSCTVHTCMCIQLVSIALICCLRITRWCIPIIYLHTRSMLSFRFWTILLHKSIEVFCQQVCAIYLDHLVSWFTIPHKCFQVSLAKSASGLWNRKTKIILENVTLNIICTNRPYDVLACTWTLKQENCEHCWAIRLDLFLVYNTVWKKWYFVATS